MMSRLFPYVLSIPLLLASAACVVDETEEDLGLMDMDDRGDPAIVAEGMVRIRIAAANITSGNYQSYDPGHGIRIFQGTDPDIVMIQELNYGSNTAADIRSFVDTAFGPSFSYYREGGAQIPNGIISRYPIIASGEWDDPYVTNRDFSYARIDIPGSPDLWAVSLHLLTSSSTTRNSEAQSLVAYIRQNIPAGDYLVIGGDLNTGSRTETCISTLGQVVVTSGPYPADRNGNANTNSTRSKPYDWALVDAELDALETPVVIGSSTFTNGLVVDTRVYAPIAEISPAQTSDSGSTNMQHMAVVRDFLVSDDGGGTGSAKVFINEILANEPGSDAAGEFVEIINTGTASLDIGGYTISDSVGTRHTFPGGTILAAGGVVVVFGGALGIPAGTPNATTASTGTLGLSNSGDTVTLRDGAANTVNTVTYSSSLASTDGVSMNRSPDTDATGTFVLHTSLSASSSSPAKRANGTSF